MANPHAVSVVASCLQAFDTVGLPEGQYHLAHATIYLATSPKSNSAEKAIDAALADVKNGQSYDFPRQLQNVHCDGEGAAVKGQHYLYPHDYPNHWVKQQYLPDPLKNRVYYEYGENKLEQAAKDYWSRIKK